MKDVTEFNPISHIQANAVKETEAYKFVKELSEALDIPLMKNGSKFETPFYYIQENNLSVFTMDHKVSIVYQPDEHSEAITKQVFPNKDLKLAVLSAYKDARLEIQKRKEEIYG
jgi:hypothetical protein